jgi:predicted PurR-regulated permease PerM
MVAAAQDARDLPRAVLLVLFILALTVGCLWILRPFVTVLIGATTLAICTWPMLTRLQGWFGGHRGVAVVGMMVGLLIAILAPLYFGVVATIENVSALSAWVRDLPHQSFPALPHWLVAIPLLGSKLQGAWDHLAAAGPEGLRTRFSDNATEILQFVRKAVGGLAGLLIQTFATLAITAILYVRGESFGDSVLRFARRLGGVHGEEAARLAASATRGVGLGVVLTPLIQSIFAGIGLAVAGVPHAGLFAVAVLLSCLAQAGPIPALVIPVGWLYARGEALHATVLLAWALVVHISGPVLRPLLIRRGVKLPMLMILFGVIGGVAAFGAIGLFIGPVILAVAATLLERWIDEGDGEVVESVASGPRA